MTFNPNIPQANDDPTASQSDLLGNFGKLNADWAVNHIPLTSGGNNGFHKMVQFPNVLASDPPVTGLQSAVYPKVGPDGNPALFFENLLTVFQLTNLPIVTSGNNYGVKTPWGFSINAGLITTPSTSATFTVPMTSNVILCAMITCVGTTGGTANLIRSVDGTTLNIITGTGNSYYYFVMGY
jgi:hypothetical protein